MSTCYHKQLLYDYEDELVENVYKFLDVLFTMGFDMVNMSSLS